MVRAVFVGYDANQRNLVWFKDTDVVGVKEINFSEEKLNSMSDPYTFELEHVRTGIYELQELMVVGCVDGVKGIDFILNMEGETEYMKKLFPDKQFSVESRE